MTPTLFARYRVATVLGLAISVALLVWTFRDVSLADMWSHIRTADPRWLAAMILSATLSFVLRAIRWKWLLRPLRQSTQFHSRFGAVCIGFMANNLLPARLGGAVAALFGFAWLFLVVLARHSAQVLDLFDRAVSPLLSRHVAERAIAMLESFIGGVGALHDTPVFAATLAWSFALWLVGAAALWFGLLAFDLTNPGLLGAVFLQSLIGFAVAIPSSPGFFGPFEAACRVGLAPYQTPAPRSRASRSPPTYSPSCP